MNPDDTGISSFLKSRRAALDPERVGLPPVLNRRRVPGLRREEVAQLAGISVDYYTRIEQGRATGISAPVLDGLARALRLTADERTYLGNLADPAPPGDPATPLPGGPVVRPAIRRLLDAMDGVPAHVVGPGLDYLAWNRLGAHLSYDLDALPPQERNAALLVFLHPERHAFHPDYDTVAAETVAALRAEVGRRPGHPRVQAVLTRLLERSPAFRELWQAHQVREKLSGVKRIRSPLAGELVVSYETFALTADEDQTLCTYTVEPGSPSHTALLRLAERVRREGEAGQAGDAGDAAHAPDGAGGQSAPPSQTGLVSAAMAPGSPEPWRAGRRSSART